MIAVHSLVSDAVIRIEESLIFVTGQPLLLDSLSRRILTSIATGVAGWGEDGLFNFAQIPEPPNGASPSMTRRGTPCPIEWGEETQPVAESTGWAHP